MNQSMPMRHLRQGRQGSRIKSSIVIAAVLAGMLGGSLGFLSVSSNPTPAAGSVVTQDEGLGTLTHGAPEEAPAQVPVINKEEPEVMEDQAVVTEPVPYGEVYGSIEIPKLGEGWSRPIYEGHGNDVIDIHDALGRTVVSRYVNTKPFGSSGITGITGHSGGLYDLDLWEMIANPDEESKNYSPFTRLDELAQGDDLRIRTDVGTYTYELLWTEQVQPSQNEVLYDQVYRTSERRAGDEVDGALVLTTCGVLQDWSGDPSIRRASYFEFTGFVPNA